MTTTTSQIVRRIRNLSKKRDLEGFGQKRIDLSLRLFSLRRELHDEILKEKKKGELL